MQYPQTLEQYVGQTSPIDTDSRLAGRQVKYITPDSTGSRLYYGTACPSNLTPDPLPVAGETPPSMNILFPGRSEQKGWAYAANSYILDPGAYERGVANGVTNRPGSCPARHWAGQTRHGHSCN
jgi:hypothetical protein